MMKKTAWVFLLALVCAILFSSVKAFGQLSQMTYSAGVKSFKNYVKNPDCAKNVLNITASGGSFAKGTTTPLNLDTGSECTIDASSSGQTYTWALSTLGQDLKGKNCEARFVFEGDASLYKAYVKNGSSQITTDLQLTYPTYSRDVSINAPCGDLSASNTVVIESTSASAAAISVAQVYFGEATNLSNVSQAQFIGSAYIATTASCNFTRTNTALGAFGTVAACPGPTVDLNPGPGTIATTDTDLPKFTVSNLPPGTYEVIISGQMAGPGAGGSNVNVTINDGTSSSGNTAGFVDSSTTGAPFTVVGQFTYTSTASRTFELYGASSSGAITVYSATNLNKLGFSIKRFPSSSEIAVRQNNTPWYIDATMDGANPSLGVTNVSSYTEIIDAGLTLKPQTGSQPVGVMCSTTNAATAPSTGNTTCAAGSESIGINFAIPEAGAYEVCFYGNHYASVDSGEDVSTSFELIETPTNAQTLTLEGGTRVGANHVAMTVAGGTGQQTGMPMTNCSTFNWTSQGTKGVRLMFEQAVSGAPNSSIILADASASIGQRNIRWTVKPITRQLPMPLLVGSVTSNTSGMERVERARIVCSSSSSVTTQSGSWLAVGNVSSGQCALTFTSGIFSAAPVCAFTYDGSSTTTGTFLKISSVTSTSAVLTGADMSSGSSTIAGITSATVDIICMGPR